MGEADPAHDPAPDLSVVVPVYGELDRLERCLAALERALDAARPPLRAEIVIADDATPGGLPDAIAEDHPRARIVRGTRNLGFAGNVNRGVAASRGAIVCLMNTDMYVAPDFFDGCLAPFSREPALFAVSGRIHEPTGRNDGYKELAFEGAAVRVETYPDGDPRCAEPGEIPYASGGGSLFRRATFDALGGLDPVFAPYYWEDTDLGLRARRRGHRIRYDPARRVEHDHQGTIGTQERRRIRRVFGRNQRRFVMRHQLDVPLARLAWTLCLAPALRAVVRLRWGRAAQRFAELRALPALARERRAERDAAATSGC